LSRLETIESRPASSSGSVSSPELNLLKQQVETLKQAVVQTKGSTVSLVKENTALKTQMDNLKKELTETKELLVALQNLTMDNSQKILDLTMGNTGEFNSTDMATLDAIDVGNFSDLQDDNEQNDIIGTDLKQLIESELNTSM
jgi:hypothetical protein